MAAPPDAQLYCPLRFDARPRSASLIRLTPQLRAALLDAQAAGQAASIRFSDSGAPSVIKVGEQSFSFTVRAEDRVCDLVRLPSNGTDAAVEVGTVKQTLLVRRNIEEERRRIRQRSQQADEQLHHRTTVLLDGGGRRAGSQQQRQGPAARSGNTSAAPLQKGLTPDGHQRAGSPAPRQGSPAPQAAFEPSRSQSPAVAQAAPAAKPHRAKSKLGLPRASSRPTSAPSAAAGAVSVDGKVIAAARTGGMRLCLVAILAAKPLTRQGVEQALAEVARQVPGFKAGGDIRTALGHVATYQSPGRYLVKQHLLRELDGLPASGPDANGSNAIGSTGVAAGDGSAPAAKQRQPKAPKQRDKQADAGPEGTAAGAKRRSKQGAAEAGAAKRHRLAAAAGAEAVPAAPAAAAPAALVCKEQPSPPGSSSGGSPPAAARSEDFQRPQHQLPPPASAAVAAAPNRQHSPAPRRPSPPAAAAAAPRPIITGPPGKPSAAFRASTASPTLTPTPTPTPSPRTGSGRRGSSGRLGSSTTSRSSPQYDESWFAPHVSRAAVLAAPIASLDQFAGAKAEYGAKYGVYFRLHQEIQSHRRDLAGLERAAQLAASPAEAARWQGQARRLWDRRAARAARWQAAFDVLDAELTSIKGAMRSFSERQRLRQQPAALSSDSTPIAAR